MYKHFLKRCLSFLGALLALILLGWLILIVMVVLHFANKGAGAFFTQERPGKDAKIFKVLKFKTMTDERDAEGNLLPDAQRLTRIGKVVRSLSIDELPQLINILKGDMAFIGPRPWKVEYLPLYSPEQMRRHEVRPGISGWAQVHGLRGNTSIEERLHADLWYLENWSLALDFKILLRTLFAVRNAY
jgi:lipopolysaccharide/colanic/teichoic acid biosynthesis glycosyltransferase